MSITQHDLEAYLDEALPAAEMARVEDHLRRDPQLLNELAAINSRRDSGVHTLGAIWRRHRLTCPAREDLGAYLLGVLPPDVSDYYDFHIRVIGCRLCQANLADLQNQQSQSQDATSQDATQTRRRRYFQSSAGLLGEDDR